MRTIGLSVPSVVREIITRNRSIHDCMAMDVINYTALAAKTVIFSFAGKVSDVRVVEQSCVQVQDAED